MVGHLTLNQRMVVRFHLPQPETFCWLVVQLVERLAVNQDAHRGIAGSSPAKPAKLFKLPQINPCGLLLFSSAVVAVAC